MAFRTGSDHRHRASNMQVCVCACACVHQWLQASTTLIGRKRLQFLPKFIPFCLLCYRIGRKGQTTVFSTSNHQQPSTQQHPPLRSNTRTEQFAFSYCWNAGVGEEDERGGGLVVSRGEFRNGSPLSFLLHSQCQIVLQPA